MKTTQLKLSLAAVAALLLAAGSPALAQVTLYDNPFIYADGTGSTNNRSLTVAAIGWTGYQGAAATNQSGNQAYFLLTDRPFLDAPADTFGVFAIGPNNGAKFTLTTGLSIDSALPDLTFSWIQGDANAVDGLSVAVEIDGQWYVNTTVYTTAAQSVVDFGSLTSTTAESKSLTFDPAAANWLTLSFTSGAELVLGGATIDDLSGAITGVGFFSTGNTGNLRLADFQITAVPEPSSWALVMSAGVLAVVVMRRRNHRQSA